MTKTKLDDFVALLKNPRRDWPTYHTPEVELCERAAEVITKLRSQNRRLKARLENNS